MPPVPPAAPQGHGRRELFVWWRCRPEQRDAAVAALRAWQQALAARHAGLACTLHERRETTGGLGGAPRVTLMESYAREADRAGITPDLQALLVAEGDALVAQAVDGARHVEVFERL